MKHIYPWRPSLKDHRHFLYKDIKPTVVIPIKVDLRPYDSPIMDQGELGSCTANALAGARQFLDLKDGKNLTYLSRLFLYWCERYREGDTKDDSGADVVDGLKTLKFQGVCPENDLPVLPGELFFKTRQRVLR